MVQGIGVPDYGLGLLCKRMARYHTTTGNLEQALFFQEKGTEIWLALLAAEPDNVNFKNGLATSYLPLGQLHRDQLKDRVKARAYIQQGYALYEGLVRNSPDHQVFKKNYEWAKVALAGLGEG
ncbi:MAG: hypothetical protein OHK0039_39690 [Bacteroidia bacterium]